MVIKYRKTSTILVINVKDQILFRYLVSEEVVIDFRINVDRLNFSS